MAVAVAAPSVRRTAREKTFRVALVVGVVAARIASHVGAPSFFAEFDFEAFAGAGDEPSRGIPFACE